MKYCFIAKFFVICNDVKPLDPDPCGSRYITDKVAFKMVKSHRFQVEKSIDLSMNAWESYWSSLEQFVKIKSLKNGLKFLKFYFGNESTDPNSDPYPFWPPNILDLDLNPYWDQYGSETPLTSQEKAFTTQYTEEPWKWSTHLLLKR